MKRLARLMRAIRPKARLPEAPRSASLEAEEDAAVTAFVHRMETIERFRAMAGEDRPSRRGLH
jgi:hypothetical protein